MPYINAFKHQYAKAAFKFGAGGAGRGMSPPTIIPASVGGLNTKDPLSEMRPEYAIKLVNFFPTSGSVSVRNGSQIVTSGMGTGTVQSLFTRRSGTTQKLYAFTNNKLYDATPTYTSDGAVTVQDSPTALKSTGITNNRWRGVNFKGASIFVNGEDEPIQVAANGTVSANHGITGTNLTTTNLSQVLAHKQRLFFAEKDSPNLWYGTVNAIQGTLNAIDISLVYNAGGNIAALDSLSVDSGTGIDDYFVIYMTSGDILVYRGNDPSDADNWGLVGRYTVGEVIGNNPSVKYGGDVIAITNIGFVSLFQYIKGGSDTAMSPISDLIESRITEDIRQYGNQVGWEAILYPRGRYILFNIPEGNGNAHQYVFNTENKAWCEFQGYNASSWAIYDNKLYFGGKNGIVYEADVGDTDAGSLIDADCQTAYNYLGMSTAKQFNAIRTHIRTRGSREFSLSVGSDFDTDPTYVIPSRVPSRGTTWGDDWGGNWATGLTNYSVWKDVNSSGDAISVRIQVRSAGEFTLHSTKVAASPIKGFQR